MDSSCEVRVSKDGSVEVMSAVQDIGGGTKTMLAQVVAEEFGIPPQSVLVRVGDTRYPIGPDSGGSVTAGSRSPGGPQCGVSGKQKFLAAVAPALGARPINLTLRDGRVVLARTVRGHTHCGRRREDADDEISARATRVPDYPETA